MQSTMVFVHVPKTAGTSAVAVLGRLFAHKQVCGCYEVLPSSFEGLGLVASHARFSDLAAVDGGKVFVTAIRKPVDRLVSMYRFWRSFRAAEGRTHITDAKAQTFEDFLLARQSSETPSDNEFVRQFSSADARAPCTYHDLVVARENIEKCSAILRTENLDEDLKDLFARVGFSALYKPEWLNVTDQNHDINPHIYDPAETVDLNSLSAEGKQALHALTVFDAQLYDAAASMGEIKRKRGLEIEGLPVHRALLVPGQTIVPCSDENFLSLLSGGWFPVLDDVGFLWSVGPLASLKLRIGGGTGLRNKLIVSFEACMVPNRKHTSIKIEYESTSKTVFFVQSGIMLDGAIFDGASFDYVCVGPKAAEIAIDLKQNCSEEYVHSVAFRVMGGTASPQMLGYGADNRPLAVRLLSIEAE